MFLFYSHIYPLGYMKRLRYCEYLGKYFCDGCHGGGEAVIPARVLHHWDFGRYPVCQFSKQLLESIWEKPLFKITDVAKDLYSQAKELQKFRVRGFNGEKISIFQNEIPLPVKSNLRLINFRVIIQLPITPHNLIIRFFYSYRATLLGFISYFEFLIHVNILLFS